MPDVFASILANSGFWFAIGVIIGLLIEFAGTFFYGWWRRPKLTISLEGLWAVTSSATIPSSYRSIDLSPTHSATRPVTVTVYRFRVKNDGRSAAKNVIGTLEFDNMDRRICWYEGSTPCITINSCDHSYLDVYGVILNVQNQPTTDIIMPTEHGWDNLPPRTLKALLRVRLRVTAANAQRIETNFSIDPAQDCKPID